MTPFVLDPGPHDGDRSPAIGDGNHQQLMMKADLAAIEDQAHLTVLGLTAQEVFSDRSIPLAHTDALVHQQAAQALNLAG